MGVSGRFSLDGRVAIITGGSRGLGKAMAEALAQAGAKIAVGSRSVDRVQAVAEALQTAYGRKCGGYGVDVAQPTR